MVTANITLNTAERSEFGELGTLQGITSELSVTNGFFSRHLFYLNHFRGKFIFGNFALDKSGKHLPKLKD